VLVSAPVVSCGTLVISREHHLLLCHVTHTPKWDIPKGLQDPGESALAAAMRELREESGLEFAPSRFRDLGLFNYRRDKRLHLFRVDAGSDLSTLDHLVCTSFFDHHVTGKPTPETDGFRWATRSEMRELCWPRMAAVLDAIDW
jgi:8-oxo-dGTP pyrophosphatase MutT (NUDIX family)